MHTSRWPISHLPISGVTPFTYRDGETYLSMLNRLAQYVTEQLHPNLRETVEHMVEEMEHILAAQHGKYVEGIQDFQRIHDAFMTDVNSALMALNDNSVSDLADDPGAVFGQTLRELFASADDLDELSTATVRKSPTITYWVHPNGSDTEGDGTEANPYATLSYASRQVDGIALDVDATVVMRLFPVDYSEVVRLPTELSTNVHYIVQGYDVGGHPNVPLTRFRGVSSIVFWSHNHNIKLTLENIKFLDCAGGVGYSNNIVFLRNVHAEDISGTAVSVTNGLLDVKGGIFRRCHTGLMSFMKTRHSIGQQHAGTIENGPWIYECERGVLIQELATGHVDYCLFEENDRAIVLSRSGHVNPEGSEFRRNRRDFDVHGASTVTSTDSVTFGTGVDRSERPIRVVNASHMSVGETMWSSISTGETLEDKMVRQSNEGQEFSDGDRVINVVLNPVMWNDPRNASYPRKAITFNLSGEITGEEATSKRFVLSLDGSQSSSITNLPSYTGPFTMDLEVSFNDRGEQTMKSVVLLHGVPPVVRTARWNADMSEPSILRMIFQTPTGGAGGVDVYDEQVWFRGI